MTPTEKRENLAILLTCKNYLYYSGILTKKESEKVFFRIKKYQDKHKLTISGKQLNSVGFKYKD